MTLSHEHGQGTAWAWIRRLIRGSGRSYPASVEGVLVARSMGRYAASNPTAASARRLGPPREARSELLAEWTRSGALTYGEAERLMALDETTPWRV
jgi:hypothetical protein